MMKRFLIFTLAVFLAPLQVQAQSQPISVSLAECSVIFNALQISAQAKGKPEEKIHKLGQGSAVFLEHAYAEAEDENRDAPRVFIDSKLEGLTAKWDERWLTDDDQKALGYMSENYEWMQYCMKLGENKGFLETFAGFEICSLHRVKNAKARPSEYTYISPDKALHFKPPAG